jgi:hypothetical protein
VLSFLMGRYGLDISTYPTDLRYNRSINCGKLCVPRCGAWNFPKSKPNVTRSLGSTNLSWKVPRRSGDVNTRLTIFCLYRAFNDALK